MPLVTLHHLLNVFVQLANKRGLKKLNGNKINTELISYGSYTIYRWVDG
jgi:hypothetical protein